MVNLKDIKNIKIEEGEIDITKKTDDEIEKITDKYISTDYPPFIWTPVIAYN